MGKELEEIKKRMASSKTNFDGDDEFNTYTKIYVHSNENLKEYIKDLKDKRVLTVAASGDHMFSSLLGGATNIDIFDINKYALMYVELRKYAIKYLEPTDLLYFFTYLTVETYLKFNEYLPIHLKEFFDYIFIQCDRYDVNERFFQDVVELSNNTPYHNTKQLKELKDKLESLNCHSYNCNLYSLPNYIQGTYDVIYLSNILAYEENYDRIFNFVRMMKECYLNDGGEIYYDYIWTIKGNSDKEKFFTRRNNKSIDSETIKKHADIYEATEPIILSPSHDNHFSGPRSFNDVVLRLKKER